MASDTFTNSNDTLLATHDSDWTSISATYPVGNYEIQSNECRVDANWHRAGAYHNGSALDYCKMTLKGVSSGQGARFYDKHVCVRAGASSRGYYITLAVGSGSGNNFTRINVSRTDGEDINISDAAAGTWDFTSDHTVAIEATTNGANVDIEVWVDDVSVITDTDSTQTGDGPITSGHPGFYTSETPNAADSGLDDWTDTEASNKTASGTPTLAVSTSGTIVKVGSISGTPSLSLSCNGTIIKVAGGEVAVKLSCSSAAHIIRQASGTPTLSLSCSGAAHIIRQASGTPTLSLSCSGTTTRLFAAPTELYTNETADTAQSGDNNPTNIVDSTPVFSCLVPDLAANVTHVRIQVSAIDDVDFSEALSFDSGFLELATPMTGAGRIEDVEYGQT